MNEDLFPVIRFCPRHVLAPILGLTLVATACGSGGESAAEGSSTASAGETAVEGSPCPTNLVIQTDWWPELEHGGTYQLIGPEGTANADDFSYAGPIQAEYAVGGVETVEIRAGGDAISFTPVTNEMYLDDDITLGYVNMSDAMQDFSATPVVGVAKTLDVYPQILFWDPTKLDISEPADMAGTGASVLTFDQVAYADYLIAEGLILEEQLDPSYGGAPDQFIAMQGEIIQQGFATNEVYRYENDIPWRDGEPGDVEYLLIDALGYRDYPAMMSVRADRLDELSPCLEVLVPALVQAWVDYLADPLPITDRLIEVNDTYNTYWKLSPGLNDAGLALLDELALAGNSPDGTYCSFEPERVAEMAGILGPIYESQGTEIADDLTQVVDNSFCHDTVGR